MSLAHHYFLDAAYLYSQNWLKWIGSFYSNLINKFFVVNDEYFLISNIDIGICYPCFRF